MVERRRRAPGRVRRTAALAALLGLMVTAGVIATPATAAGAAQPVVFILDASGSMVRETSPGVTRMDDAKRALNEAIEALPAGTEAGLLVFGTGTGNDESERAAGCSDVTTLAALAPVDASTLTDAVDAVQPSGFTPIGPALRQAAALLPADAPGNIVLISDGVDTCAPPASCEVASEIRRANPQLAINVVAFGVDDDEAAQQQMTCIGGVGGGTSVTAADARQLAARLRAVVDPDAAASRLSAQGLRGIRVGMTLDEVRARVDGAKVGDVQDIDGVEVIVVDCGWGTVELRGGHVHAITPKDDTATAEGIAPGTVRSDVEALYGAPVATSDTDEGEAVVYPTHPGSAIGYRVTYAPGEATVRRIIVCRCVPASALGDDPATWEIGFDGVGPLELGMTEAAARAAVPRLDAEGILTDGSGTALLSTAFHDDRLVAVRVGGWAIEQPEAWGSRLPHARGIRLGDSGATALNTFPEGSYFRSLAGGLASIILADREGRLLTFDTGQSSYDFADEPASEEEGIRRGMVSSIMIEDSRATRAPDAWEQGLL